MRGPNGAVMSTGLPLFSLTRKGGLPILGQVCHLGLLAQGYSRSVRHAVSAVMAERGCDVSHESTSRGALMGLDGGERFGTHISHVGGAAEWGD